MLRILSALLLISSLTACSTVPTSSGPNSSGGKPAAAPPCNCPPPPAGGAAPTGGAAPAGAAAEAAKPVWLKVSFADLRSWASDRHAEALPAFRQSCTALRRQPLWREICNEADRLEPAQARNFFENRFEPWRRADAANSAAIPGMVTGYYEPLLIGSRTRRGIFTVPVLGAPEDLLTIDLGELRPEMRGQRLRGRLEGNRVVPYYTREEIESGRVKVTPRTLLFVDDAVELFFLQVQGSGRIRLENGDTVRLNYADQNGHPYRSIGRLLVERGEMKLEQASMQGIKAWAKANPTRLNELLYSNPSYVFFREVADTGLGPLGAQGVPITAERSIAIDPTFTPLGAPIWLVTTAPNTTRPYERLVVAQDTGGAIRGVNRTDLFWGFGEEAGREAGRMRQSGELFILWPRGAVPVQ
jgi:membrane-bound lytic murein transglycosylase A